MKRCRTKAGTPFRNVDVVRDLDLDGNVSRFITSSRRWSYIVSSTSTWSLTSALILTATMTLTPSLIFDVDRRGLHETRHMRDVGRGQRRGQPLRTASLPSTTTGVVKVDVGRRSRRRPRPQLVTNDETSPVHFDVGSTSRLWVEVYDWVVAAKQRRGRGVVAAMFLHTAPAGRETRAVHPGPVKGRFT
jgi:hypothetical protein